MLYPVLPVYLKSIGFSVVLIGILEGIAEATAGLSKGYFGKLSDNSQRRAPFVQIGYALSSVSKPMMAIYVFPLWIFFARTIDRLERGFEQAQGTQYSRMNQLPKQRERFLVFTVQWIPQVL